MGPGRISRYFHTIVIFLVLIGFGVSCAQVSPKSEATPIASPDGWKLVWHDEFDGKAVDTQNWTYDLGAGGWGNGEAQYYTSRSENARFENGVLIIEARQEKFEDSYYTSARLKNPGFANLPVWTNRGPPESSRWKRVMACFLDAWLQFRWQ